MFEIIIFCFVVAICDLVHAVEATYGLRELLKTTNKTTLINLSFIKEAFERRLTIDI